MWLSPFQRSLATAAAATLIATATGTAAALALRRLARRRRGAVLRSLFIAPIALPYLAYAIGLFEAVSALNFLSDSLVPVVLGQAVLAFPLVFLIVSSALANVDPALAQAAYTLGARWPLVVRRIELPLVRRSIYAAALFAMALCFDEPVLALFLAPPDQPT